MALAIGVEGTSGIVKYAAVFKSDEALAEVESLAESIRKRGFEAQVIRDVEWLYDK